MATSPLLKNRLGNLFFTLTLLLMFLTGFGQMPIYKRYYLSDIPGMGWLADFYATRYVHYLGAAVLIFLVTFFFISYILNKDRAKMSASGMIRTILFSGIVISGILLVIKNYPGYFFSPDFIVFLNLFHLGSVMMLLMVLVFSLIFKKGWVKQSEK